MPIDLDALEAQQSPQETSKGIDLDALASQPAATQGQGIVLTGNETTVPAEGDKSTLRSVLDDVLYSGGRELQSIFMQGPSSIMRNPLLGASGLGKAEATVEKKYPHIRAAPILGNFANIGEVARTVENWAAEKGIWTEPNQDQTFLEDVGSGLGQSLGFMAGGVAGNAMRIPTWIMPASMGALQEAGAMQAEAEMMNATPEQQAIATIAGLALGSTEALPTEYFLNKLNKATGGKLWDGLKAVGGVNGEPGALRTVIESFANEFVQEGGQTIGENIVAQQTYDPERELGETFWRSALAGGVAGVLMGGGMHPFIKNQQQEVIKKQEANRNLLLSLGLPINLLEGDMMPLENRPEQMLKWQELDAAFEAKGEAALDEWLQSGEAGTVLASSTYPNALQRWGVDADKQGPDYSGSLEGEPWVMQLLGKEVDPKLSKLTVVPQGAATVDQTLRATDAPVVAAKIDYELPEIQRATAFIQRRTNEILKWQQALAASPNDPNISGWIKAAKAEIDTARKQRTRFIKRLALRRKLLKGIADWIDQIAPMIDRQQLPPATDPQGNPVYNETEPGDPNFGLIYPDTRTRYVVQDREQSSRMGGKILGSMGRIANFKNDAGENQEIGVMQIDLGEVVNLAIPSALADLPGTKEEVRDKMLDLLSTVAHEFGHSFGTKHVLDLQRSFKRVEALMNKSATINSGGITAFTDVRNQQNAKPDFIQQEDWDKAKAYLAMVMDYRQFMHNANKNDTILKFMMKQRGPSPVAAMMEKNPGAAGYGVNMFSNLNYILNFDEYMAHRFERMLVQAKNVRARPVETEANGQVKLSSLGMVDFDLQSKLDPLLNKNLFKPLLAEYRKMYENLMARDSDVGRTMLSPGYNTPQAFDTFMDRVISVSLLDKQLERIVAQGPLNRIDVLKKEIPGFEADGWAGLAEEYDKFTKFHAVFFNLIQIARENPHVAAMQKYFNSVALQWAPYARKIFDRANNTLHGWRKLGKESGNRISNLLLEEAELGEEFTPTEIARKLTEREAAVYYQIRKDFNFILGEMQRVAEQQAHQSLYDNEEQLQETLEEIAATFAKMKGSGYFPYMRFGKYILEIRANRDTAVDGKVFKKDQLISWESFDSKAARAKAMSEWGTRNGELRYGTREQTDATYSVQGLPMPLLRALKNTLEASGAEAETLRALDDAIKNSLPLNSFKRHFLRKRGIKGFSMDLQRSYAAYMRMSASHLSRVENSPAMTDAIKQLRDDVQILTFSGRDADARSRMLNWAQEHYNYIMNPGNELQALRSLGFFWFLGFNIKSGVVNLFQQVTTGLPYMEGRFGDLTGLKALMKAQKDVVSYWKNRDQWIFDSLDGERKLLSTATKAGALDPAGNLFQLGQMQPVHPAGTKFWDLSAADLANTNEPAVRQKLLETALEQEQREVQPNPARVAKLNALITGVTGPISVNDFIDAGLEKTVKSMGMHGAVLEDGRTSVVFVGENFGKVKEISEKEFKRRQAAGSQNLRRGEIVRMIQRGQAEGWLDQSLAMELAIAASENRADRLAPLNAAELAYYKLSEWGAMPFHITEKLNRQVMAMAAYNAARDEGRSEVQSIAEARQAVHMSMYEHANWNRPSIMRGKKSALFLFMNYVQNTAYFATRGDKAALRHWLIMGLLAGAVGLPFAQDAEDLINFVVTRLNELLGIKSPKFQLRQEARKLLSEMNMNPDLILHGFGQTSFGLAHGSRLMGIPFPEINLSGSIGLGNVVPGTGVPTALAEQGFDPALKQVVTEVSGAAGKASVDAFSAMLSTDPNQWKQLEKIMPMAARNVSKAARYAVEGEEKTAAGEVVAEFDPNDPRASMEIGAMALGFMPARVSRGWERILAERELVEYYRRRQSEVTKNYAYSIYVQDREQQADAWRQVKEYNSDVPYPELMIKGDSLTQSIREYITSQIEHKVGKVEAKNYRLTKSLEETYKIPADVGTLGSD